MKKLLLILALCIPALGNDAADNASERVPPPEVTGVTNDSGKQVGVYDFIVWLLGKDKPKK